MAPQFHATAPSTSSMICATTWDKQVLQPSTLFRATFNQETGLTQLTTFRELYGVHKLKPDAQET